VTSETLRAEDLVDSAKRYAMSALQVYGTDQHERFPFYAAISLEHLAKACLVTKNSALLIELKPGGGNEESLLMLCGAKAFSATKLRTISLATSLDRLNRLSIVPARNAALSRLIDFRDGNAHLGQGSIEDDEILNVYLERMESILVDLEIDTRDFWDHFIGLVDSTKVQNTEKIVVIVERKVAQSQAIWDSKIAGLDEGIISLIRHDRLLPDYYEETSRCPVCGSFGMAKGEHKLEGEVEYKGGISEWVAFYAESFKCPQCQLALISPAEMEQAGMESEWGSDISPKEFNEGLYGELDDDM